MAYRFNAPPNWQIDDPNWTPPPGWQPDPAWGPAPEGWNFWIEGDAAPSAPVAEQAAPAPSAPEQEALAVEEQDDATRVVSVDHVAPAAEEPAPGQASVDAPAPVEDSAVEDPAASAEAPAASASEPAEAPGYTGTYAGAADAYGSAGTADSVGEAAQSDEPAPAEQTDAPVDAGSVAAAGAAGAGATYAGSHRGEPRDEQPAASGAPFADDDATHVASTDQQAQAGAAASQDDDATHVASTDQQAQVAGDSSAPAAGASETAEYQGSDLQADLAQQAPYETAGGGQQDAAYGQASPAGYGDQSEQGYGQASPAGYGDQSEQGYGQASPAPYGQQDQAVAYGQASPAGYGQQSVPEGYGQGSPAGYGQASPAGYGQGSASDYPAPGYGQGSPAASPGAWTAATAPNEAPKKSAIARFWWVGCLALVLVFALIAAIVGIYLFSRSGNDEAGGGGTTTTTEESPEPTDEEPTDEETTDEEEYVSPDPTTPLPTMPAEGAQTQEVISDTGTANVTVHMQWQTAENLPSSYGGTVEPAEFGEYLVVTAQIEVTEGEMHFPSFYWELATPYGGTVSESVEIYGLADSGRDYDSLYPFKAGETYTYILLYDVQRAGGNKLVYSNWTDEYSWDVVA